MILGGFMAGSYPSKGQSLFQLTVFVSDVIDTVSTTTGFADLEIVASFGKVEIVSGTKLGYSILRAIDN
jgi:hypothetical protein